MRTFKGFAKAFMISLMTLLIFSSAVHAADKPLTGKNLVVFINSADVNKAGMGSTIGMAASALAGANVTIVIGSDAVSYALKDSPDVHFKPQDKSIRQLLEAAIQSGANVYLCGMFAKAQKITDTDVISGIKIIEGIDIFKKVYEPDARTMSF